MNHRRPPAVGGFDPYSSPPGVKPDPKLSPEDLLPSFTDSAVPVPDDGSRHEHLHGRRGGRCGRWTDWRQTPAKFNAPEVLKPGLHAAKLLPDLNTAVGHVVKGDIEIEFSWDWADRSPDRIEFSGKYHLPGVDPGPASPGTFQVASNTAGGNPVVVKFSGSQVPSVTSAGHTGSVVLVNASLNPQPNSDLHRYRLTLHNATFDFTNTRTRLAPSDAAGTSTSGRRTSTRRPARAHRHEFDPVPPTVKLTAGEDQLDRAAGRDGPGPGGPLLAGRG